MFDRLRGCETEASKGLKYIHVKQTASDVQRRAKALAADLKKLLEEDAIAFAPVIALRRETGKISDSYRHDQAVRQEVAASKPATDIPLRIASLALRTGELALEMLDGGFAAARGEAYTALVQSIGANDGALYVARMNVRTIRQRAAKLNDLQLEAPWIEMKLREVGDLRNASQALRVRASLADKALDANLSSIV